MAREVIVTADAIKRRKKMFLKTKIIIGLLLIVFLLIFAILGIVFNVNNRVIPYLIDLTYNQFFKAYNDDDSYVLLDDFVVSEEQKSLVSKLNKDGYIELNDELLKVYINMFLDFYKDKKINRDNVYRNVVERIEKEALLNISSITNEKIKKM